MILALLAACTGGNAENDPTCDPAQSDSGVVAADPCAWVDEDLDDEVFADFPPVVLCTSPRVGAVDVDPDLSEIRVTFSKEMADGNWSWVQVSERQYPELAGDAYYATDRTNVLPVALESGHTYVVWLNYDPYLSFQDIDGNSAVPYQLTFRTADTR